MRSYRRIVVCLFAGAVALVAGAQQASAQYAKYQGKIVVTQKPLPDKEDELTRFLDKNAVTAVDADKGGDTWTFNYYAALSSDPPQDMLEIAFYEATGASFKRVNLDDVKVGGKQVQGSYKLHKLIGYAKGKRYQMRILLRGDRGEKVFAKSALITLK